MATMTATNIRLVEIVDLRPIDIETGARMKASEMDPECKHVCAKCGKLHATIYVIDADGEQVGVGPTCCKHLFEWEPTEDAVKLAKAAAKDRDTQAALNNAVAPLAEMLESTIIPDLKYHSYRWTCFGYDYIFLSTDTTYLAKSGNPLGIRVCSKSGNIKNPSEIVIPQKDHEWFAKAWKRAIANQWIDENFGHWTESKIKKLRVAIHAKFDITYTEPY